MTTIGERVKTAREKRGMKQAELARKLRCSVNALSMLEHNTISDPRASRIIGIAATLQVSADALSGLSQTCQRRAKTAPRAWESPMPTTRHWISQDLDALSHEVGTRYEIIAGEISVSHQPSWHHQYACCRLIAVLEQWGLASGPGEPAGAPGLIFAADTLTSPTLSGSSCPVRALFRAP
jgi:transcriptional regulator with XRE-family HTH domain